MFSLKRLSLSKVNLLMSIFNEIAQAFNPLWPQNVGRYSYAVWSPYNAAGITLGVG